MFGSDKPEEQKSDRPFSTPSILVPSGKKSCPQCNNGKAIGGLFQCTKCGGKGYI